MSREYWSLVGPFGFPVRAGIRIIQFALSIIILGLFASDFPTSGSKTNHIYALVVTVLSIFTDAFHCIATVKHGAWFLLDFCIGVLWAALAGITGRAVFNNRANDEMFGNSPLGGKRATLYTAIAALSLISMCFWLLSCIHGCAWCCAQRRKERRKELELVQRDESRHSTV